MKIALIDAFPLAKFTAEREFIARCMAVLTSLGHKPRSVTTSDEIEAFGPDLVISTHDLVPKLTDHFTIGVLWSPTSFFKDDASVVRNIRSWDLVVPINEALRQYAVDLHFPLRHRSAVSRHLIYPSAPILDMPMPNPSDMSLAYVGVHWDGARHEEFLRKVSEATNFNVYGPEKAWEFLPDCYRGPIPFDGTSLFRTLNSHGIVLAMHKDSHVLENTPSMRTFEAAASKCLILTDPMESLKDIYGDAAEYIDFSSDVDRAVRQVASAVNQAKRNPKATLERIKEANKRFAEQVSLEALLPLILKEAQEIIERKTAYKAVRDDRCVSVIVRCGSKPLKVISRAVDSIIRQTHQNVSIIFTQSESIEGFESYLADLRASSRFKDVVRVQAEGSRSASLWAGLNAIKSPFFALLDDNDEWFHDHLQHIMEEFRTDKTVDFVHSGGIVNEENGTITQLHPRLLGQDGTYWPESRLLHLLEPINIRNLYTWRNVVLSQSFVARSALLTEAALDDPHLDAMEDVYLYLLFASEGAKFRHNGRASVIWNWRSRTANRPSSQSPYEALSKQSKRIALRLGQQAFLTSEMGADVIGVEPRVRQEAALALPPQTIPSPSEVPSLQNGIDFRQPQLPVFVQSLNGVSIAEGWGRWTVGYETVLQLSEPLPKRSQIELTALPSPHMISKNVTLMAGKGRTSFRMKKPTPKCYRVPLNAGKGTNTLILRVEECRRVSQEDVRPLGIGLISLKITKRERWWKKFLRH